MTKKGEQQKEPTPTSPIVTIDYELYEDLLADTQISEAEKKEFLDTVFAIVLGFVQLGYGVHPLQQAAEAGTPPLELEDLRSTAIDMLASSNTGADIASILSE